MREHDSRDAEHQQTLRRLWWWGYEGGDVHWFCEVGAVYAVRFVRRSRRAFVYVSLFVNYIRSAIKVQLQQARSSERHSEINNARVLKTTFCHHFSCKTPNVYEGFTANGD